MKRTFAILFALIICLTLSVPAFAIDPIDTTMDVTLTVTAVSTEGTAMSGMTFDIYKVADVSGFGTFTPTKNFEACAAKVNNVNQDAWTTACQVLADYVSSYSPPATDRATADKTGMASFPSSTDSLSQGLYLIVGQTLYVTGAGYDVAPMLVSLPNRGEDDLWDYSVGVVAKTVEKQLKLTVTWKDTGYESARPKYVTVQLLQGTDKTPYGDPVILSADNNWSYTWENLPQGVTWSVTETIGERHYTYVVESVPGGLKVINTYTPDPVKTLPQTGLLVWPIPVLVILGLALFTIGWVKRRRSE